MGVVSIGERLFDTHISSNTVRQGVGVIIIVLVLNVIDDPRPDTGQVTCLCPNSVQPTP